MTGAVRSLPLLTSDSVDGLSGGRREMSEGAGFWFGGRWAVKAVAGMSAFVGLPEGGEEECSD